MVLSGQIWWSCIYFHLALSIRLICLALEEEIYIFSFGIINSFDYFLLIGLNAHIVSISNYVPHLPQIVYRLYPGNFKNLKDECDVFLRVVQKFASLITDAKSMHSEERSGQLRNWQVTFVD